MLTDAKAMKQRLANGTSDSSHSAALSLPHRRNSEPAYSDYFLKTHIFSEATSQYFKNHAYPLFDSKGKKTTNIQHAVTEPSLQTPSDHFDPRRLLDPKNFNKKSQKRDERSSTAASTFSGLQSSIHTSDPLSRGSLEINGKGAHKRGNNHKDIPSLGNLIERVHNVSQREERPQKKQKTETFEEENKDSKIYRVGGKGGEIGEYIKQKKKEGLEKLGPTGAFVDLTGGMRVLTSAFYRYLCAR